MDLYTPDGALDFEKARQRVRDAESLGDRSTRDDWLRIIGTAALVDVAESLAVISAESAHAIRQHAGEVNDRAEPTPDPAVADDDFLTVGDLVVVKGSTEPGEIVSLGFDQGELFADVAFANGAREKYYARNLERIVSGADPEFTEALAARVRAEAVDEGEPEIVVEDAEPSIEDDFDETTDGRPVSSEAEKKSAADAIEDAKKARGKGKKGSK